MILDDLQNASTYFDVHPRLRQALEFLQTAELDLLEPGRHDIDGDRLFASVADYTTKRETETRWEAHRRYGDVQYVMTGRERIGVAALPTVAAEPYDEERDILFGRASGEFVTLTPGRFIVLYPQDAHMPGICDGEPAPVRKLVIKFQLALDATSRVEPIIP